MNKSSGCLKIANQTIRKQILTLTFMILILTVFLVSMILYINNLLISPRFIESSETMYFKSAKKNLQTNLYRYKSIISKTLEINGLELIAFHKLYNEVNKMVRSMDPIILNDEMNMNYGGTKNIPEILWTQDGYGGYNTTNSFLCYSNLSQLTDPLTYEQQVGIKIQEYFQAFGQMVYIGDLIKQQFVYFYTIVDNTNFIYPCLNRGKNIYKYFPQTRNWYVDALEVYNSHNFTDYTYLLTKTYILYTGLTMGLSMYLPMINEQEEFIGSIGTNILSSEFSSFFQGTNTISMVMLVDEEGVLIVHNFTVNFSDLPLMIYNQNLTGFNQEDWDYIIKKEGKTQCIDFQFNDDLICVHNTFFDQDVLIEVTYLQQYKLHLIIFQDTTELRQFQSIQQNKIQQFFTDYLIQVMSYAIYLFLFCAVFIIFMIILIMGPIHKITKSIYKKMNKNEWGLEKINSFQEVIFSQTLLDFYNSYFEFVSKISGVLPKKKSEFCLKIENIKYPNTIYRFNKYIMNRRMKFIYNQGNANSINSKPSMLENLNIIINALKNITKIKK